MVLLASPGPAIAVARSALCAQRTSWRTGTVRVRRKHVEHLGAADTIEEVHVSDADNSLAVPDSQRFHRFDVLEYSRSTGSVLDSKEE